MEEDLAALLVTLVPWSDRICGLFGTIGWFPFLPA